LTVSSVGSVILIVETTDGKPVQMAMSGFFTSSPTPTGMTFTP